MFEVWSSGFVGTSRLVAKSRNVKGISLFSELILFAMILVFWKRFNTLQGFSICGPSVASVSRFPLEVSNQSFWSNTRYWKLDKLPNPDQKWCQIRSDDIWRLFGDNKFFLQIMGNSHIGVRNSPSAHSSGVKMDGMHVTRPRYQLPIISRCKHNDDIGSVESLA